MDRLSLCIISLLGHAGRLPYEQLEVQATTCLRGQGATPIPSEQAFRQTLDVLCEQYVLVENSPKKSPLYLLSPWGMQVYCQEQRRASQSS